MPRDDRQRTSLVVPILLIAFGVLFLYKTWHPGFEPYQVLKTYWPLILVLVGLGKIWDYSSQRRTAEPGQSGGGAGVAVGSTIGVVAFVFVLIILLSHYEKRRHSGAPDEAYTNHSQSTVELQGAKSVSVALRLGAGELNVRGGSAHLMNADFHYDRKYDKPDVQYHVDDGKGTLEVNQEQNSTNFGPSDNVWDVNFSDEVPLELRVDMGAGEGNLKLRNMELTDLELHMGAGHVFVDLTGPRDKDLNVSIKGGVGQATIRLPKDVGVSAHARGGLGSIDAAGLMKDGDEYHNDAYGKSAHKITLDVEGGIGEIDLQMER